MAVEREAVFVPLTSATIEVRFPGDARIDTLRGEFQQAIRSEFPLLLLPKLEVGDSPSLMHYRFSNENSTRTIDLAVHSLVYTSEVYPGWVSFLTDFLRYLKLLNQKLEISAFTRVAVRFENRFYSDWQQSVDFARLPLYMAALQENVSFYRSLIQLDKDDHYLLVSVYKPQDNDELQIDYDAFVSTPSSLEQLEVVLERLHATVETEFLTSINQKIAQALDIAP